MDRLRFVEDGRRACLYQLADYTGVLRVSQSIPLLHRPGNVLFKPLIDWHREKY
jgi:hypothetical protein